MWFVARGRQEVEGYPLREIEFQLEPADVEAWYLSHLDSRAYRVIYWAGGLVTSGIAAVRADQMVASVPVSAVTAVVGFGVGWALARIAHRSYLRGNARELANEPGASKQFGSYRLVVDDAGVSETGPVSQHRHSWEAVLGVKETEQHLFLLVAGGSAYVIPKRAFKSAADIDSFRALVSQEKGKAPRSDYSSPPC